MKTAIPEIVGLSSGRLSRINSAMQSHIKNGKLPGLVTMVARHGQIAYAECFGWMDIEEKKPMKMDAIFRLASMTKPITSVAAMMLYEEGLFQLSEPISDFIPEFRSSKVFAGYSDDGMSLVDADRDITISDILTFRSGLISGYGKDQPLQELYEDVQASKHEGTLEDLVKKLAELPLLHQPGKAWRYGESYEVLARLVEVVSGMSFANYLQQRIFEPLGMFDTGFYIREDASDRLTAMYGYSETAKLEVVESSKNPQYLSPPLLTAGGGNLLGTAPDYMRFAQMLLNGGELEGVRILGRKTVEFMINNHLPSEILPISASPEEKWSGYGYGLGFGVLVDPAKSQILGSIGEYGWLGYFSTSFWIDPKEELIGIFMTQVGPVYFWPNPNPPDFKVLVYQAIID